MQKVIVFTLNNLFTKLLDATKFSHQKLFSNQHRPELINNLSWSVAGSMSSWIIQWINSGVLTSHFRAHPFCLFAASLWETRSLGLSHTILATLLGTPIQLLELWISNQPITREQLSAFRVAVKTLYWMWKSTRHGSPQEQEAEATITQVHQNWTTADRQALCGEMKGLLHPDSTVQPGEVKVWFGCTLWAP